MKQMEAVRQKVLEKPGTLPRLVLQLQQGDTDAQAKAAEMLFCVVGQGPGRNLEATRQVSSDSHTPTGTFGGTARGRHVQLYKASPTIRAYVSWCCGSLSICPSCLPSLHE